MPPLDDRDEILVPESSGIDRSLSYLFAGLLVACFFGLMLLGMSRVERLSKTATSVNTNAEGPPPTEIGGP